VERNDNCTEKRSTTKHTGIEKEQVGQWRKDWPPFKQYYLPQLLLISDEFEITQLNRTRKIGASLPRDFYASEESHPVMYLEDASICSPRMPNMAIGKLTKILW
jgi:hypothetical protein